MLDLFFPPVQSIMGATERRQAVALAEEGRADISASLVGRRTRCLAASEQIPSACGSWVSKFPACLARCLLNGTAIQRACSGHVVGRAVTRRRIDGGIVWRFGSHATRSFGLRRGSRAEVRHRVGNPRAHWNLPCRSLTHQPRPVLLFNHSPTDRSSSPGKPFRIERTP